MSFLSLHDRKTKNHPISIEAIYYRQIMTLLIVFKKKLSKIKNKIKYVNVKGPREDFQKGGEELGRSHSIKWDGNEQK